MVRWTIILFIEYDFVDNHEMYIDKGSIDDYMTIRF